MYLVRCITSASELHHKRVWTASQARLNCLTTASELHHNSVWTASQQRLNCITRASELPHKRVWTASQGRLNCITSASELHHKGVWTWRCVVGLKAATIFRNVANSWAGETESPPWRAGAAATPPIAPCVSSRIYRNTLRRSECITQPSDVNNSR